MKLSLNGLIPLMYEQKHAFQKRRIAGRIGSLEKYRTVLERLVDELPLSASDNDAPLSDEDLALIVRAVDPRVTAQSCAAYVKKYRNLASKS